MKVIIDDEVFARAQTHDDYSLLLEGLIDLCRSRGHLVIPQRTSQKLCPGKNSWLTQLNPKRKHSFEAFLRQSSEKSNTDATLEIRVCTDPSRCGWGSSTSVPVLELEQAGDFLRAPSSFVTLNQERQSPRVNAALQ